MCVIATIKCFLFIVYRVIQSACRSVLEVIHTNLLVAVSIQTVTGKPLRLTVHLY